MLQITPPGVSFQIKALENSLGVRLFERGANGVSLSPAGHEFLKHCIDLEKVYDRLEKSMGKISAHLPGKLTVGITNSIARLIFPDIVTRFREKCPKVQLTAQIGNSGTLLTLLRMNMLDVAVAASTRTFSDLYQERYLREELTLIVAPEHAWAKRRDVTLGELRKEDFIAREPGSGTRGALEYSLREHGLTLKTFKISMVLGTTDSVISAVKRGIGVSVVPRFSVQTELKTSSLVEVKLRDARLVKQFFLMCKKERVDRPQVGDFLACWRGVEV